MKKNISELVTQNKGITALIVIGVILLIWGVATYNGLVTSEQKVESTWSEVESAYQRRADLIPNLVATVKGYAKHEAETLEAVVRERANATNVKIDLSNATPEDLQKYQAAQGEIGNALSRLIAVSESYPDLKASDNFKDLQRELAGTENRINTARRDFIEAAKEYNTKCKRFPTNLLASMFGFEEKPYFKAQEGADKAPKVDFETSEPAAAPAVTTNN